MKPFTAVIAVHGGRECLELTLETLLAVGKNYLESVILIDSSWRTAGNEDTTNYVNSLVNRDCVRVIKSKKRAHAYKIDLGIQEVTTPYTLVLDSDVEFYSGHCFTIVNFMFRMNQQLFMVGHGQPICVYGTNYIQGKRLYDGAVFLRTDIAKKYISKNIGFYRKSVREKRCCPGVFVNKRNLRVLYDTGSFIQEMAERDGYHCVDVYMNNLYYKHLHAGSYRKDYQNENFLVPIEVVELKNKNKIWQTLSQEPFDEWPIS